MVIEKFSSKSDEGFFLRLTKSEALSLAESLIRQVRTSDVNSQRPEYKDVTFIDETGKVEGLTYFSAIIREP